MEETKELIFNSMREASDYFGFPYDGKTNKKNDKYLSCYCEWERISRNKIRINKIYDTPKELEMQCTRDYKYNVEDIIYTNNSSIKVLEQIRIKREKIHNGTKEIVYEKGYLVKCLKDSYEFEILESSVTRSYGCPVCSNHRVVKGINDVATTHPEIAKYFENVEETYTTTYSSGKKKRMKCPRCGHVKLDTPNHISYFGFSCPCCSDGISYPNKFMAKLLHELNIEFDREIVFEWCKYPCYIDNSVLDYGSYDFVIPSINLIIEMDGGLGHGKRIMTTISHNRRKISLEETIYRDKMKDILANENGYRVIRIDCEYESDIKNRFETVRKNIIESELSKLFDLSNIDFNEIDDYCLTNSYIEDAAQLWNKGLTSKQIQKEMKISPITVCRYLEICEKLGLCDYNAKKSRNRSSRISKINSPYLVEYDDKKELFGSFAIMKQYYADVYKINIIRANVDKSVKNKSEYLNRTFTKISQEEFNKYYNDKSLTDLVVGEAFLIA